MPAQPGQVGGLGLVDGLQLIGVGAGVADQADLGRPLDQAGIQGALLLHRLELLVQVGGTLGILAGLSRTTAASIPGTSPPPPAGSWR
jgi:hypothetical protein